MEVTKQHLNKQLNEVQQLLWSGALDEVDKAHNIIADLIKDIDTPQAQARVNLPNLQTSFTKNILRTFKIFSRFMDKPSNLHIQREYNRYMSPHEFSRGRTSRYSSHPNFVYTVPGKTEAKVERFVIKVLRSLFKFPPRRHKSQYSQTLRSGKKIPDLYKLLP